MFLIYALDSLFFCANVIVTFEIFVNSARIDLSKYHLGGYIFTQQGAMSVHLTQPQITCYSRCLFLTGMSFIKRL